MKELLALKKKMNQKRPAFIRQDSHKKAEIGPKWRKPRGMHSKIRLKKKGYRKMPNAGYRSPNVVRGMHMSGLTQVLITSLKDLENVSKESQGAIISSSFGIKKRIEALKLAKEKGITVLNIKNPDAYLKEAEENMKKKKEDKKSKAEKKQKKKKAEKPKEKKEAEEETKDDLKAMVSEEEKKIKEKKEKDKALIKKGIQ
jgi:large subunit ribosomal protein L32e